MLMQDFPTFPFHPTNPLIIPVPDIPRPDDDDFDDDEED